MHFRSLDFYAVAVMAACLWLGDRAGGVTVFMLLGLFIISRLPQSATPGAVENVPSCR
jgi:hypothetical protein